MRSGASRDAFPSGAWERHNALFGFVGGAVAVCFEGCCGSMCWPRERPATHAAAGAAARGVLVFCLGDCFTCLELGNDTETTQRGRSAVAICSEGGCASKRWTLERPHTAYRRWTGNTRGFDFLGLEDSFTRSDAAISPRPCASFFICAFRRRSRTWPDANDPPRPPTTWPTCFPPRACSSASSCAGTG